MRSIPTGRTLEGTVMSERFHAGSARQPDALEAAVAALARQPLVLDHLADLPRTSPLLVLTGMGSSYDACLGAASILGRAGITACTVTAAELLHFRLATLGPGTVL